MNISTKYCFGLNLIIIIDALFHHSVFLHYSVSWIYKKNNRTVKALHVVTNGVLGDLNDRYSLHGQNLRIKPLKKEDSGK